MTPWTVAHQAPLSFTISWSLLKLMSNVVVIPSNHLILCCPPLLLPSIFPIIKVFSNELAAHIKWPKYWNFTSIDSVMPSNHLILCHPLLFLPSIFPSIRVFSNELALHIRWPQYWSFSFKSVLLMNT